MKRIQFFTLMLLVLVASCKKDSCHNIIQVRTPIFQKLADVRSAMHSNPARTVHQAGKLYFYGNYIFLNDVQEGIHVIDNQDPAHPLPIGFIPIPGNADLAVKGNYLYADSWADLVVLNLSDIHNIQPARFVDRIFSQSEQAYRNEGGNPADVEVIASFNVHDSSVSCSEMRNEVDLVFGGGPTVLAQGTAASSGTGIGGSMARFAIVQDHLYTLSGASLQTFSLANAADPQSLNAQWLNWSAETIFPFQDKLFIGTTAGLMIYDLANAAQPQFLSAFGHMTACDPVITDGQYAYVTLRSGNMCAGNSNQMDVLRVSNLQQPEPVRTYLLSNPRGLAKDGNKLFVCDDGLKYYNAQDPANLQLLQHLPLKDSYDAIAYNGVLLVVAADGLYQYNYSGSTLQLLSKIPVGR